MVKYQKKTKFLHIVFKSTNCVDYIYPFYFKKIKHENHTLDFLIWDVNYKKIKDQLPYNFNKYCVKDISYFIKSPEILKLKKFFIRFIDYQFLFNYKRLNNYIKKFDKIFFDCKSFESLFFKNIIFDILKENKLTVTYVPHGPHYRTSYEEMADNNLKVPFSYKLILSNKKSNPWITKKIKKKDCLYLGFPSLDTKWKYEFNNLNVNTNKRKTIGFLFRPFRKQKNRSQLKNDDYYVNSYEENIFMINLSKSLFSNGYNIVYRLHPSSNRKEFLTSYKKDLKKIKIQFSKGSIHNFISQLDNVISFHSTSLIYAAFYNKKIFLIKNDLESLIYKKWPKLKKIYNSFSMIFENKKQFYKVFYKKKKHINMQELKRFW